MKKEELRRVPETQFEGMISVRALIEAHRDGIHDRSILSILYDAEKAEQDRRELAWLEHRAEEMQFSISLVSRQELDELAIGTSHGGVIAHASDRTIPPLKVEAIEENGFYAMLDGIEDPYNFGYAIRSLYAMGVKGIVLSPRNWMSAGGVVCRASAGASERLPMFVADAEDAIGLFRRASYRTVAADLRDATPSASANLTYPIFLLVGGEKRGISRRVLDLCDERVCIDYARPFSQSLSAASAATILAYEIFRQNRKES